MAQEESRSLSKNISWAIRKQFANGNFSIPYSNVLGFKKGTKKHSLVLNTDEAKIVKFIFKLALVGYTPNKVAKILTVLGFSTPMRQTKWSPATVSRMLRNEKYKGDALLQKSYTVDFLTRKKLKNNGVLPQYYIENSHEAIIEKNTFNYIQQKLSNRDSKSLLLSGKLLCSSCRSNYMRRRVHSTTYNNLLWKCVGRTGGTCQQDSIYQEYLLFKLHQISIKKAVELGVGNYLVEKLNYKFDTSPDSLWEMDSYIDELSIIIEEVIIFSGKIQVKWIDGSISESAITKYKPIMGEKEK